MTNDERSQNSESQKDRAPTRNLRVSGNSFHPRSSRGNEAQIKRKRMGFRKRSEPRYLGCYHFSDALLGFRHWNFFCHFVIMILSFPLIQPRVIDQPGLADEDRQRQVRTAPDFGNWSQSIRLEEFEVIHPGRWLLLN